MAMVPIDDLLPDLLVFAPNAPDPLAFKYLREAAQELCTASRLWRETDQFEVSTPDAEGVCTIQDADIIAIEWAKLGDTRLEPVTPAWLDSHEPEWSEQTTNVDSARYVTQLTPNTVTVVPRATGTLKLRLVLKPSRSATMVPDWLVEQFGSLIGKGAAGRILILPDPANSNPQLGTGLLAEFEVKKGTQKMVAAKGQQGAPLRTTPRWF